jgi:SOS-response transcriptional repressor LexA
MQVESEEYPKNVDKVGNNVEKSTTNETCGERIAQFIEDIPMKRGDFAEYIGVSYDKLQSYIQDKAEPRQEFWSKLKHKFPNADISLIMIGFPGLSAEDYTVEGLERVPVLAVIGAGSLSHGFRDEEVIEWVWAMRVKDKDTFSLKITGDSMVPEIYEGDYVLCAPRRPFVNGKIYAVVAGDSEHTIKRVFKERQGYRLVPSNPEYDSTLIKDEDIIKLVRVVQVLSFRE